jgi:hypothetical protein
MSLRVVIPVAIAGAALWALTATAACIVLLLLSLVPYPRSTDAGGGLASPAVSAYAPSAEALADIPRPYLALYQSAAARFGLDWTILAGIGKVECDHGRDPDPSCTQEGHLNYAGAGGPAQFLVSTWTKYGISAGGSGRPDMWSPADAIDSMANYLHAAGAPGDYPHAIYAYNHAWWYVAEVMAWARRYRARYGATPGLAHAASAGMLSGHARTTHGEVMRRIARPSSSRLATPVPVRPKADFSGERTESLLKKAAIRCVSSSRGGGGLWYDAMHVSRTLL